MKKEMTTVDFRGTKEQEEQLIKVIDKYAGVKGAMMPILQGAQEIYGVVSFYAQFKLNPSGEVAIAVCLGTACYVKGSGEIIEAISDALKLPVGSTSADGKYSLEATRCIGACGLAPVLTVNGEVYGRLTKADVPTILAKYQ